MKRKTRPTLKRMKTWTKFYLCMAIPCTLWKSQYL